MAKSFYAVILDDGSRKIFRNHREFQRALKGQTHSRYRGFDSHVDARVWLEGPEDFPKAKHYYVVRKGRKPGIYCDTEEFMAQMRGYAGCEGQGFYTLTAAKQWLGEDGLPDQSLQAADMESPWTEKIVAAKQWAGNLVHCLWVMLSTVLYQRPQLRKEVLRLAERQRPWIYCRIKTDHPLVIYTDASYQEKGAGYAAVIIDTVTNAEVYVGGQDKEIKSSCRAELCAIIRALQMIDSKCTAPVEIRTDALSLVAVARPQTLQHLHDLQWKKKSVANIDLWQQFYELAQMRTVTVNWVRGHSGNYYNGKCDRIAGQCAEMKA